MQTVAKLATPCKFLFSQLEQIYDIEVVPGNRGVGGLAVFI